MVTETLQGKAIVTRGQLKDGKWAIEDIQVRSLKDNELLVEMVASGICHTDVVLGENAEPIGGYPKVMGHEGTEALKALKALRYRTKYRMQD